MSPIEQYALYGCIIFLFCMVLRYMYVDLKRKYLQKKRFKRGFKMEEKARSFLKKEGFKVVAEQAAYTHHYEVNGEKRESKIVVDYMATKDGKQYVVEVKSGRSAISVSNSSSRRQLLEYDFAIENDGVILLDMENKLLQHVNFHPKEKKSNVAFIRVMVVLAIVGVLVPFWSVKIVALLFLLLAGLFPERMKAIF